MDTRVFDMMGVEVTFSAGQPITDFVQPCGHVVSYLDGQFIFHCDTPAQRVYNAMMGVEACACDVFRDDLTWTINRLGDFRGRLPRAHSIQVGQFGFSGGLYVAMME